MVDVTVFYLKKMNKLQSVPPSMSLEALLTPDSVTDSASDGIDGGTGCNFIFFYFFISPCSLSWPHRHIFFAQIWHVAPLAPSNDHLRIRFLI